MVWTFVNWFYSYRDAILVLGNSRWSWGLEFTPKKGRRMAILHQNSAVVKWDTVNRYFIHRIWSNLFGNDRVCFKLILCCWIIMHQFWWNARFRLTRLHTCYIYICLFGVFQLMVTEQELSSPQLMMTTSSAAKEKSADWMPTLKQWQR